MINAKDLERWFAINGKARIVLDAAFAPNKYTVTVEFLEDNNWKFLASAHGQTLEEAVRELNNND